MSRAHAPASTCWAVEVHYLVRGKGCRPAPTAFTQISPHFPVHYYECGAGVRSGLISTARNSCQQTGNNVFSLIFLIFAHHSIQIPSASHPLERDLMYLRFVVFCFGLMAPAFSWAMDFSIERLDLRPIRQPTLHITASGRIQSGDTEKLKAAIEGADLSYVRDVLFLFDSPGGSLLESLKMGAYIADIPATVSAQVGASDIPNAICASANG